ncbi:MAG: hypothetical protein F8N39_17930 [Clostridiaceae bacterium]|nr:hypothetical protein [Clostridiaceae bacterium]
MKGKLSFDTWWNHIIIDNKQGIVLTRRQILLAVCNKDGGAHIDEKLSSTFADTLNKLNIRPITKYGEAGGGIEISMKNEFDVPSKEEDGIILSNLLAASIRQITYEVLK